MSPITLTGKTCVVVGANRGIGLEFVRQLVQKGNTVIATSRRPTEAAELQELVSKGSSVHVMELDASKSESIDSWSREVQQCVDHVDVLINNLGMMKYSPLARVSKEEMMETFETNVCGPLFVIQALYLSKLLGGKKPTLVVNMTSKMGSVEDNGSGGYYSYRASKAALNIINASLQIDLEDENITSVLMHPGYVRTRMTGFNGNINPDESVRGMLSVLEGNQDLGGNWYDFQGNAVPW